MSKHVNHLLAAYVEKQLSPEQAVRVYQHVIECSDCRARLAQHEQLAGDLQTLLGQGPSLRPGQVQQLWLATGTGTITPISRQNTVAWLPLLLSLLLLIVPFTAGFSEMIPGTALAVTASHSPGKVAAQPLPDIPRAGTVVWSDTDQAHATVMVTLAMSETLFPVTPVPLAPVNP
ncbi:MAG: zf-HC2 domain-containing protein [Anaerolineae bacterium]|nr:zf-HC2 domain-containing protein [Anaerolineae bacterium]